MALRLESGNGRGELGHGVEVRGEVRHHVHDMCRQGRSGGPLFGDGIHLNGRNIYIEVYLHKYKYIRNESSAGSVSY